MTDTPVTVDVDPDEPPVPDTDPREPDHDEDTQHGIVPETHRGRA